MPTNPIRIKIYLPYVLIICWLGFFPLKGKSQVFNQEEGLPYLKNYSPNTYHAFGQNWVVKQHPNGFMYFGNGDGVLEFDGNTWRIIPVANRTVVRSLAIDRNQTIWVGATREFGYLEPDSTGQLKYVSLVGFLNSEEHKFAQIHSTVPTPEGIYFQAYNRLFRYRGDSIQTWVGKTFFKAQYINQKLHLIDKHRGLLVVNKDSLEVILSPEQILGNKIDHLLPYSANEILICMENGPFYLFDGKKITPFEKPFTKYLDKLTIIDAEALPDTNYLFVSYPKGLIVADRNGDVLNVINKENGLSTNLVFDVERDAQYGVWLATDNGISRIEPLSPLSNYDQKNGLEGPINGLIRHNGSFYAATGLGVFRLEARKEGDISARFQKLGKGMRLQAFSFLSIGEELMVISGEGLFLIQNDELKRIASIRGSFIYQSPYFPNRVYLGMANGIGLIEKIGGTWKYRGKIKGNDLDTRTLFEVSPNQLWAGLHAGEILRLDLNYKNELLPSANIVRYNETHGLPKGYVTMKFMRHQLWFRRNSQMYSFDPITSTFSPDTTLAVLMGLKSSEISPDFEDANGNIWFWKQAENGKWNGYRTILQPDSSFKIWKVNSQRITQDVDWAIYPEGDSIVWYGGADGLVQIKLDSTELGDISFSTFIRKISLQGDSLIFGGVDTDLNSFPRLEYAFNSMRFEYSASTFDGINITRFQFFLEGFDKGWSEWTDETKRDYTNLPEGDYTFRVRAINIYGRIGTEDHFSFRILPPWYRAWWAYLIYLVGIFAFLWGIVKWRLQQMEAEKIALEKTIEERTKEVAEQNIQLEKQASQLKENDLLKSRFFANISHEFRTPLTLILGPLEDRLTYKSDSSYRQEDYLMHRNASRLLRLVNQLLDLSRLESETLHLIPQKGDLVAFLRTIIAAFNSLSEQKKIIFLVNIPDQSWFTWYDPDKVEKILYNLLSNAFNFTPEGGQITISIEIEEDNSAYQISVHNSDSYIPESEQNHIFDRFYQLENDNHQGTGIGLALVKELVALHKGEINVESDKENGTLFRLRLNVLLPAINSEIPEIEPAISDDSFAPKAIFIKEKDSQISLEKPEILIVEDNNDVRRYLYESFENDFHIREAIDGKDGRKQALTYLPDLIVSDLMMPNMDGMELCSQLKEDERTSHIPIILLTAKANIESRIEGLQTGADDYLTKPFNKEELRIRIDNLISQRKKLRKQFSKDVFLQPREILINSMDERFLNKALEIIENNIDNTEFSVQIFREELNMSKTQLQRKIKALTNQSPSEFIRNYRLERAAQLLAANHDNISQIAFSVGFNNLSYFAKCFKEHFGVPPSEYVKKA